MPECYAIRTYVLCIYGCMDVCNTHIEITIQKKDNFSLEYVQCAFQFSKLPYR